MKTINNVETDEVGGGLAGAGQNTFPIDDLPGYPGGGCFPGGGFSGGGTPPYVPGDPYDLSIL
ncbi:MAG: hypothetical protein ABI411_10720 [Tahibacter sp.]